VPAGEEKKKRRREVGTALARETVGKRDALVFLSPQ
jgi:hypothetical protein